MERLLKRHKRLDEEPFPFFCAIYDISLTATEAELNCLKNGYLKKAIWHEKVLLFLYTTFFQTMD